MYKFFLFLSLLPLFLVAQNDLKTDVSAQQIDELFEEWDDLNKPGIAIGIVKNGKIDHMKGYGSAHLEHQIPISPQTKFLFAGMSDQIIAYLALHAASKGKLQLNDPIGNYLPELHENYQSVTILQLLQHTSGVPDIGRLKQMAGYTSDQAFKSNEFISMMGKEYMDGKAAGSEFEHSYTNIKWVQMILEKKTGKSIAELANEVLFKPLEMTGSSFEVDSKTVLSNKAEAYYNQNDIYRKGELPIQEDVSQLFYTTVEDMCKWLIFQRDQRRSSSPIMSKFDSLTEENGTEVNRENAASYLGQHKYWNFKGTNKLYLIGVKGGYACKTVRFPDQDLSIVVMGNAGAYNGHWSSFAADLYLGKYYESDQEEAAEEMPTISLDKKKVEAICGTYWAQEQMFTTTLRLENDTLRYTEEEFNWTMNLLPVDANTFVSSYGDKLKVIDTNGNKRIELTNPNGVTFRSEPYDEAAAWVDNKEVFVGKYVQADLETSYEIVLEENVLYIVHRSLGKHALLPLHNFQFKTQFPILKHISFEKNSQGQYDLLVSNDKIKSLRFSNAKNIGQNKLY